MKLALDAMGGDNAPSINIDGAKLALESLPSLEKIFLVGDKLLLEKECQRAGLNGNSRIEIVHASEVVEMNESGLLAVRKKKNSSMSVAVDLVKEGKADAVLSAGNTGAAVAASTIKLRLLPGIERAGIVSPIPSELGYTLVSDTGANPDAKPRHLIGYGVMASLMATYIYNRKNPTLGIMSNGTEDNKGSEFSKETYKIFHKLSQREDIELPFEFGGNCEGHDLFHGDFPVILTDGFTGNIVLKSVEATAKTFSKMLKQSIKSSIISMAGAILMKKAFTSIKTKLSADTIGGSPLMGVNGVSIIAHGSANKIAICNAIAMAEGMYRHNINDRIIATMQQINEQPDNI